jgi:hypothetical protein
LNTISATTLSQRTAYAAALAQTASAMFAMDAMLRRRPDHLKMPPPDAYDQEAAKLALGRPLDGVRISANVTDDFGNVTGLSGRC